MTDKIAKPTLTDLQQQLDVLFKDDSLIERAFIHRSYLNEHPKLGLEHNERLEFLGDAVLELVVTDHLYRTFPNPEGDLTNWRSALVKTESLSAVAEKLQLDHYLKLSRGESKGNARSRALILANCVEALIGAIYLDQGYEAAKNFVEKHIISTLDEILKEGSWIDPKSRFQELAQEREGYTPHYKVLGEAGPDHDKEFEVGVFVGDRLCGKGRGSSKQAAQQQAAATALESY
ncbi:MAG TPA: ribonuclease III [Candidatus Saccharimonadales bacterium]|nr:ribonuclease III [Candidatus Saccharimonadales bacterium]